MQRLINSNTATKKILSKRKSKFYNKLTPERIQILFQNVSVFSKRLSPINCSRNILATKSDIDKEIEYAKRQASLSPVSTKQSENYSAITTKSKINSQRTFISSIKTPFYPLRSKTPERFITKKPKISIAPKTGRRLFRTRGAKIRKLANQCKELRKNIKKIAEEFKDFMSDARIKYRRIVKVIENSFGKGKVKNILDREKELFEPIKGNLDLELSTAKALRRGKKVWKFNHITFMNYVDRIIYYGSSGKRV